MASQAHVLKLYLLYIYRLHSTFFLFIHYSHAKASWISPSASLSQEDITCTKEVTKETIPGRRRNKRKRDPPHSLRPRTP